MLPYRLLPGRHSPHVGILLLVLAFGLALTLGDAAWIWSAYRKDLATSGTEVANLSRSLAQHAKDTVGLADALLLDLEERLGTDGLGPASIDRIRLLLINDVIRHQEVHGLFVFDEHGDWVVTSVPSMSRDINYADRAYFQYHQTHPDLGPHIGAPVRSKADGSWIVTLSRRWNRDGGRFGGIVLATLSVTFFTQFYETFDVGPGGIVALVRDDGLILARKPFRENLIGRDISSGETFQHFLRHDPATSFEYTALLDRVTRIGSEHAVDGLPMLVIVAHAKADVLGKWRASVIVHIAGLLMILVALGVLARRLALQVRDTIRAEASVRQANARLVVAEAVTSEANRRLQMAEQIARIGHWRVNLPDRRVTWSDEVYRIYGVSPAWFAPTAENAIDAFHPEDREIVRHAMAEVLASRGEFQIAVRLVRSDGEIRCVTSRGVAQVDPSGEVQAIFGVFVDTTEQKLAEAELVRARATAEAASRALRELALQDGLTGLANRRQLDTALDFEIRRARRSIGCIALIMLDVDYFKQFNDRYGHPAGDSCLRAIADVVRQAIRRAGDVAARYGGEELAVLLPDSDHEAALEIASRIGAAVRHLAIAHRGSPKGIVTISAGIAALVPVAAHDTAEDLIRCADAALYRAKQGGRDRACLNDPALPAHADGRAQAALL